MRRGYVTWLRGTLGLFCCMAVGAGALPARGEILALAGGIAPCVKEIHGQYVAEGNPPLEIVLGPCGGLARQIAAGAPFDLFLFAEDRWPRWMEEKGLVEEMAPFAIHSLALWSLSDEVDSLEAAGKHKMACPKPETTAYGMLAERMLREKGLWEQFVKEDRFIFVKSAPAAALAVRSGSALSAFVPLATAEKMRAERGGTVLSFPEATLDQVGGLLPGAGENSRNFWNYVFSPGAAPVWEKWHFRPCGR